MNPEKNHRHITCSPTLEKMLFLIETVRAHTKEREKDIDTNKQQQL